MSEFRRRLMMGMMQSNKLPTDGVYIQSIDGKFYTSEEWTLPNEQANGVAVIDARHPQGGFVIAKEIGISAYWCSFGMSSTIISNITTTTDVTNAKNDYNGELNSSKIILQDASSPSITYCRSYIFPNGKNGYLPACGELVILYEKIGIVNSCMSKIGGATISTAWPWTSTQYSNSEAWRIDWSTGNPVNFFKNMNSQVRPFTTLQ